MKELEARAEAYVRVALANIEREFPHAEALFQTREGSVPRPRELHPAFYGSLDWHSCVEMHWVLVRLLRLTPERVPESELRTALDSHLSAEALAGEVRFFGDPANRLSERPYGWAWALRLAAELEGFDDADAKRWSESLKPLADLFVERLLEWLPKVTYPFRAGLHGNPAFAFSPLLPFARGPGRLLDAVNEAAARWYGDDAGYSAQYE